MKLQIKIIKKYMKVYKVKLKIVLVEYILIYSKMVT